MIELDAKFAMSELIPEHLSENMKRHLCPTPGTTCDNGNPACHGGCCIEAMNAREQDPRSSILCEECMNPCESVRLYFEKEGVL